MAVSANILQSYPKKPSNRKGTIIILVICLTLVGFHFFIFDVIVPKTASLAMPYKWRMIPLRQNKEVVRGYFGTPAYQDLSKDQWAGGTKDRMYELKIYYIYDTVAASYSIHYRYHKWFSSRDYVIDSGSIR